LNDNQINEYLYKEAIGKIKKEEGEEKKEENIFSPSSSKVEKSGGIKRRIEFIDKKGENQAKHYAILSYTWDGEANETIK